ncbi:MAG: hypothetical protein V1714_04865 [Pseudomonadota bacterium]
MASEILSIFISFISALAGSSSQIREKIKIVSIKVSYIGKTVNGKQYSDFAQYKILFKILVTPNNSWYEKKYKIFAPKEGGKTDDR